MKAYHILVTLNFTMGSFVLAKVIILFKSERNVKFN